MMLMVIVEYIFVFWYLYCCHQHASFYHINIIIYHLFLFDMYVDCSFKVNIRNNPNIKGHVIYKFIKSLKENDI